MSISRSIAAAAEVALSTAGLLVLLLASLLVALLSVQDTRGWVAVELGLSDEAAATLPSCLCFAPELDLGLPAQVARPSSVSR